MDKLNLSPQERRLVAGVGLVVFIILNILLVWPHFGDWRKIQSDRDQAERTLNRYRTEVNRTNSYLAKLTELERQGASVAADEQDLNLANLVRTYSLANKVEILSQRESKGSMTKTNQFFEEQAVTIDARTGTEELVNFLTSLTGTNSLIRVRDLNLKPDPPQAPYRLSGQITVVASYQKKVLPAKAAGLTNTVAKIPPAPAASAKPTAKPAAPAATNRLASSSTNKSATKSVPANPSRSKP